MKNIKMSRQGYLLVIWVGKYIENFMYFIPGDIRLEIQGIAILAEKVLFGDE